MFKTSNGKEGKEFEEQFKHSLERVNNMYVHRLQDSPMSYNKSLQQYTRFTLKNPYDYFCYKCPNLYCFELKSTKYSSLSISKTKEESKMIKYHQITGLKEASQSFGVIAGFIFNFRESEKTYFMNIKDFLNWLKDAGKWSINENDIISNNAILIEQELLRTTYRYNIEKLMQEIANKDLQVTLNNIINRN